MNKSVPAFVIGLVFSIIGALTSWVFTVAFLFVGIFATGSTQAVATLVPYLNIATFALSFIGSIFCLSKAKVGGILMMIAAVCSFICFIIICLTFKTLNLIILLFWVPTILILVAALLALKKKKD